MKIDLIGPLVDDHHEIFGTWHRIGRDNDTESVLDGMLDAFGPDKINYIKGCDLIGEEKLDKKGIQAAIEDSDFVVMLIGEGEYMSGEAHSRAHLGLTGM